MIAPIALIHDIRQGAAGVTVPFQATETIIRHPPVSVVSPFGNRRGFNPGERSLQGKFFVVEADRSWTLDGHRFLVNEDQGFFLDRVVTKRTDRLHALLATDRDTGLCVQGTPSGFGYSPRRPDLAIVDLPGRVGLAVSVEPSNWGSFLLRVLPKAILLRHLGVDKLIARCAHPNQRQLLELAGWRPDQIVEHQPSRRYRAQQMVLPSELCEQLALGMMGRSLIARVPPSAQRRDRKLFVSRRPRQSSRNMRYCINHDALELRMQSLGFEVLYPELLSAREQMQVFAEAAMVVGPSGAGLFNTLFCCVGTTVLDIESEPSWIHGHSCLFSSLGLRYAIHVARPTQDPMYPPPHRPFEVDLDALAEQIETLQRNVT